MTARPGRHPWIVGVSGASGTPYAAAVLRGLYTADGTVAYINTRPSLSNYGNYIVLRHQIQKVEIYSLYAHLHEVCHRRIIPRCC